MDERRRSQAAEAMRTHRATFDANSTEEEKAVAADKEKARKRIQLKRAKLKKLGEDATPADKAWLSANPGRRAGERKTERKSMLVRSASTANAAKIDSGEAGENKQLLPRLVRSASTANAAKIDSGEAAECKRVTLKRDGEQLYRQSAAALRSATESARLGRARGEGETPDGLSKEERVAQGTRVAERISQLTISRLSGKERMVGYIAVGNDERMDKNWRAAEADSYKNLGKCEGFRTLLGNRPSAYAMVEGKAQRFNCALVREVCPLSTRSLHLASSHLAPPDSYPSPPPLS